MTILKDLMNEQGPARLPWLDHVVEELHDRNNRRFDEKGAAYRRYVPNPSRSDPASEDEALCRMREDW